MCLKTQQANTLLNDLKNIYGFKFDSDIALTVGVTRQAVRRWRKEGIPRSWLLYFKEKYPKLDIASLDKAAL